MSSFSTRGVKEGGDKLFITPGINENITVVSVTTPTVQDGKSPYIQIDFVDSNDAKAEGKFYYSDKAADISKKKMKHLMTKFITEDEVDNIDEPTIDKYAAKVAKVLVGKTYTHFKFAGKEIAGKMKDDGTYTNNWFKAEVGFVPFCDVDVDTKLKFDKNNAYDMQRLPVSDSNPISNSGSDGLPF